MDRTQGNLVANTQIVVLMGGLGTRLGLKDRPKAMVDVNGVPFFDYQLKILKRWGFQKLLFLVGYQAETIESYYGNGSQWGISIQYSYDGPMPQGTGGALKWAKEKLEDDFLLLYGDSFMDIDYQEVVYRYHLAKGAGKLGVMTIFKNENRYDTSNVIFLNGELLLYDKATPQKEMQYIDYGVSMLSKSILVSPDWQSRFDLADVLTPLSKQRKLAAQVVTKRFYEIGTPNSLQEFCEYARARFDQKRKAVFLDRDGVINELVFNEAAEQIDSPFYPDEFQYRPHVLETLQWLQSQGFYLFIVTNQPAAAKGKTTLTALYDLNTWMVQDLNKKGISVEFSALCPHHPSGAPQNKTASFLIQTCNCRKPKPGMITDLLQTYNIDTDHSYMVGDSYTDIIAGKAAELKTVLQGTWKCDICQLLDGNRPDAVINELTELKKVIGKEESYG